MTFKVHQFYIKKTDRTDKLMAISNIDYNIQYNIYN